MPKKSSTGAKAGEKVSKGEKAEKKRELVFKDLPDEARCKPEGAIVDARGRLSSAAYKDLVPRFAKEPALFSKHPDPKRPGVNAAEETGVRMRWWSDPRGEGWISQSVRPPPGGKNLESKWFNRGAWGSWRLCFLLARLQRDFWTRQDGGTQAAGASGKPSGGQPASSSSSVTVVPKSPNTLKRKKSDANTASSPAKRPRPEEQPARGRGRPRKYAEKIPAEPEVQGEDSHPESKARANRDDAAAKDKRYRLRLKSLFPATQKKKEQARWAAVDRAIDEAVDDHRTRVAAGKKEREQRQAKRDAHHAGTSQVDGAKTHVPPKPSTSTAGPSHVPKAPSKEDPQARGGGVAAKSARPGEGAAGLNRSTSLSGTSSTSSKTNTAAQLDKDAGGLSAQDMDELERELLAIGRVIESEDLKMSDDTSV
mmetsp:Transcript_47440/g.87176  ORF Transcript_47440/g.87176 Transcript_47440/m.87176 type:complete len:424 (-) Transcript_47440:46-1317(-)